MKKRFHLLLLLMLPLISLNAHAIDIKHIVKEVKGYLGDKIVKAYCMVKKDCHQRVVYVVNVSQKPVTLNGCNFGANTVLNPGAKAYTARKNSKGSTCQLEESINNALDAKVTLNPHDKYINFEKKGHFACIAVHTVLKSWQKCPVIHCGKYNVNGYIAICSAMS